jgi:hypothetical protein
MTAQARARKSEEDARVARTRKRILRLFVLDVGTTHALADITTTLHVTYHVASLALTKLILDGHVQVHEAAGSPPHYQLSEEVAAFYRLEQEERAVLRLLHRQSPRPALLMETWLRGDSALLLTSKLEAVGLAHTTVSCDNRGKPTIMAELTELGARIASLVFEDEVVEKVLGKGEN